MPANGEAKMGDRTPALRRYTLVILRRGPRAFEFSDEELDLLQQQHLDHLQVMRDRGAMLAAGPFTDQPDEALRGLCLYVTDLAETKRLAEMDPSVQAGRMAVDVLTWLTPDEFPARIEL